MQTEITPEQRSKIVEMYFHTGQLYNNVMTDVMNISQPMRIKTEYGINIIYDQETEELLDKVKILMDAHINLKVNKIINNQ